MAPTAATRSRANKPKPDPVEEVTAPAKAPKKETVQQLKNRLRNEAEREVLNTHKDEVIKITAAKYEQHNLEYVRRLSDEEKAAKAIEEHLAQFPNLRQQLFVPAPEQQQAQQEEREVAYAESDYADVEEGVGYADYPSVYGQPDGNQ